MIGLLLLKVVIKGLLYCFSFFYVCLFVCVLVLFGFVGIRIGNICVFVLKFLFGKGVL